MSTNPTAVEAPATSGPGLDRDLMLVASVVVLGAVMSILDTTVVNVAINTLSRDFDTPLATIQWVATGYTLALATVIPLTGWAADRFGTKRLYLASIFLFLVGSMLAGIAWSSGSLIAFRVLQGLGGGMLMPAGMTILTRAAGPQRVGRVMAIIGVPMMLGPICGPILGGWLVDSFSWRWIFYINLPIAVAALVMSQRVLPRDVPQPQHRLDWQGLLLLSPGLAALIYGLAETSSAGGFASAKVLGPGLAGLAALALFVRHALRTPDALIDLRLFANRTFAAASATLLLVIVAVFGGMLLLPLYLQAVRGESAMATGLLLAPQGLGAMIAMPLAGRLTDKTGIGRIVPVGLVVVAVAFLGLTQLKADTSYWLLGAELFLLGVGMGITMMPTFSGAMQTLRRAAIARASSTLNINQQVGASIGTAILSVLLAHELTSRLPSGAGGGGGIGAAVPPAVRERLAPFMASAFASTFWWALALVVVAFVVAVMLLPRNKPEPVDDPSDEEPADAAPLTLVH
jgi:EmrB/QacA subfamily drug resistance transporter